MCVDANAGISIVIFCKSKDSTQWIVVAIIIPLLALVVVALQFSISFLASPLEDNWLESVYHHPQNQLMV